jgi:hypothetical protein
MTAADFAGDGEDEGVLKNPPIPPSWCVDGWAPIEKLNLRPPASLNQN